MRHKIDFFFQCIILITAASSPFLMMNDTLGILYLFLLQFFTGVYQLISSAIRTANRHLYSSKTRKLFRYYWYACLAYAIGSVFVLNSSAFTYLLISWAIAIYYTYISYHLAFPKYQKNHLDI